MISPDAVTFGAKEMGAVTNDLHAHLKTIFDFAGNHRQTTANMCEDVPAFHQTYIEGIDGTRLTIRPETVHSAQPAPGRTYPVRFHIDTQLNPSNPQEISRITIHGANDDEPNVVSGVRFLHGADGHAPETVELNSAELFGALAQIKGVLETWHFPAMYDQIRQVPGAQEIVEGVEAEEAQHIVKALLAAEKIPTADITSDTRIVFDVLNPIEDAFESPYTIKCVVVSRLDDANRDGEGLISEVYLDYLDMESGSSLSLMARIIDDGPHSKKMLQFWFFDLVNQMPEGVPIEPIALDPDARLGFLAAMRKQLTYGTIIRDDVDGAIEA